MPDETDEERRELERCVLLSPVTPRFVYVWCRRMVAEAAAGKSKHQSMRASAKQRHKDTVGAGAGPGTATPKEKVAGSPPTA